MPSSGDARHDRTRRRREGLEASGRVRRARRQHRAAGAGDRGEAGVEDEPGGAGVDRQESQQPHHRLHEPAGDEGGAWREGKGSHGGGGGVSRGAA